jgi:hypothetical protein
MARCLIIFPVYMVRILLLIAFIAICAGCNRTPQGVNCAPLTTATEVRISQPGSEAARHYTIADHYRVRALVKFANGRRDGFSPRRKTLPAPATSATFFQGSQPLLTFSAGANFFSLACAG